MCVHVSVDMSITCMYIQSQVRVLFLRHWPACKKTVLFYFYVYGVLSGVCRVQKNVLGLLELDLQMVVSQYIGARN